MKPEGELTLPMSRRESGLKVLGLWTIRELQDRVSK